MKYIIVYILYTLVSHLGRNRCRCVMSLHMEAVIIYCPQWSVAIVQLATAAQLSDGHPPRHSLLPAECMSAWRQRSAGCPATPVSPIHRFADRRPAAAVSHSAPPSPGRGARCTYFCIIALFLEV